MPASASYESSLASKSLKDLKLRDNYSSDDANILEDFFRPCLACSRTYFRSVGFLDSKILGLLGEEFENFAGAGGECRLLVGRTVSIEDYMAIKEAKEDPDKFLVIDSLASLWKHSDINEKKKRGLLVLSWLVARGIIKVRFSIRPRGIHHDKFAYFQDSDGNEVISHGTNNESEAAFLPEFNYESLSVYKSWENEIFDKLGEYKLSEFLKIWDGKSRYSISVDPPTPELEKISCLSDIESNNPQYKELFDELRDATENVSNLPYIPRFFGSNRFKLYDHQREAINRYYDSDYNGIFAMATGSGKTITAIYAVTQLAVTLATENDCDILIVVGVPYQVLADQWAENLEAFGYHPILAFAGRQNWEERFNVIANQSNLNPDCRVHSVVVVNRTLQSPSFQSLLGRFSSDRVIFIGDECHRLGTVIRKNLVPKSDYNLGLSATPWAKSENELRNSLLACFGHVLATFGLQEAFDNEVLVRYRYFPKLINLTEDEGRQYSELSNEIKTLQAIKLSGGTINEDQLNFLLNERASLIGSAEEKFNGLPTTLQEISETAGLDHLLVYCGSGTTEDENLSTGSIRDIERAQNISLQSMTLNSGRITANERRPLRKQILNSFENGTLDAVFAIKVLDEGFDMPGIKSALILASSRNERQFIQRRGRVLRKSTGKRLAYIWDYLVCGDEVMSNQLSDELAKHELNRVVEFARLALNFEDLKTFLESYATNHGVDLGQLLEDLQTNHYEAHTYDQ